MPACKNTPAEAAAKHIQIRKSCSSTAAWAIIDLEIKPDVSGNDEIAKAPTMPQIQVIGML